MNIYAKVSFVDAGLKAIEEAVKELKRHEVMIGIPDDATARENGEKVTNAELLFIHTNGSPSRGIPVRPVLEPAIENDKERVAEMLKKAVDAAVAGNKEGVLPALEHAGLYGENIAKKWFTNPSNGWIPDKQKTLANRDPKVRALRKRAKNAKKEETRSKLTAEAREAAASATGNPLIDTGEMRESITHVVKKV